MKRVGPQATTSPSIQTTPPSKQHSPQRPIYYMDPFIKNVNELFQKEIVNIPQFIVDTQESFEKDILGVSASYPINTIISPIFYFFDRYLNDNIGSYSHILKKFIQITKIDKIDGLTNDIIIDVSLYNHATIFNIFNSCFFIR